VGNKGGGAKESPVSGRGEKKHVPGWVTTKQNRRKKKRRSGKYEGKGAVKKSRERSRTAKKLERG